MHAVRNEVLGAELLEMARRLLVQVHLSPAFERLNPGSVPAEIRVPLHHFSYEHHSRDHHHGTAALLPLCGRSLWLMGLAPRASQILGTALHCLRPCHDVLRRGTRTPVECVRRISCTRSGKPLLFRSSRVHLVSVGHHTPAVFFVVLHYALQSSLFSFEPLLKRCLLLRCMESPVIGLGSCAGSSLASKVLHRRWSGWRRRNDVVLSLLRRAYWALSFSSCSFGAAAFSCDLLLSLLKFCSQGIRLAWSSPALYPIPSGLDGRRLGAAACAAQYLKKHVAGSI